MEFQPLLTTGQICKFFQVTDRTIYNWRKNTKNPFPEPALKGYPNKWKQIDIENYVDSLTATAA